MNTLKCCPDLRIFSAYGTSPYYFIGCYDENNKKMLSIALCITLWNRRTWRRLFLCEMLLELEKKNNIAKLMFLWVQLYIFRWKYLYEKLLRHKTSYWNTPWSIKKYHSDFLSSNEISVIWILIRLLWWHWGHINHWPHIYAM